LLDTDTILDTPQNTCKIDKINVIFLVTIGQISQPWTIVDRNFQKRVSPRTDLIIANSFQVYKYQRP
jgi:hypothetical protein